VHHLPPTVTSTASPSTTSSSSASRFANNNRPQLTIAMPLSFAPSSRLGPHSATTLSPSVPLPTKEQLAARSRRYTAPSGSRHPLLLLPHPQPSATSNAAGAGFPSSPARAPVASASGGAAAAAAALASPFPSHRIVLPQGYQKSPRTSSSSQQQAAVEAAAAATVDDDDILRLPRNQTIVSNGVGKRYVSSAPNVSLFESRYSLHRPSVMERRCHQKLTWS
jgi:hypothetical protein